MSIRRSKPASGYTLINNKGLSDSRLSFKARGIMAYLMSKPDTWRTSSDRLVSDGPDKHTAILSALKELEEYGYLVRDITRNADGTFKRDSILFDEPQVGFPVVDNPVLDNPVLDNPGIIVNTELTNTELTNTEGVKTKRGQRALPVATPKSEPVSLFREFTNRFPNKAGEEYINLYVNDLDRWRTVLGEWLTRGYSPVNVKGMVEWYNSPERMTQTRPNNNGGRRTATQVAESYTLMRKELGLE